MHDLPTLYADGTVVVVSTNQCFPCAVCLAPTANVLSSSAIKSVSDRLVARFVRLVGGRFAAPFLGLPLCGDHLPAPAS